MRRFSGSARLIPSLAILCAVSSVGGGGLAVARGAVLDLSLRAGPAALIATIGAPSGISLCLRVGDAVVLGWSK